MAIVGVTDTRVVVTAKICGSIVGRTFVKLRKSHKTVESTYYLPTLGGTESE